MKKHTRKNNADLRFGICRRGYDISQVEEYIANVNAKADETQLEQRERISALNAKCDALDRELRELKGREEQIKTVLINATQNAKKMTEDVKAKYALELERLSLFRSKWQSAYEQMKDRYHFDKDALNMESVALTTQIELKKFLEQSFGLEKGDDIDEKEKHFRSEVERLTRQQLDVQKNFSISESGYPFSKDEQSGVSELKQKIREAEEKKNKAAKKQEVKSESAFSFEEALNPTESLAEICQYLGLKQS